ncbi:MAG TPA: GDP-mannose 4,6-dehydratase [Steroidobacteraceae bacterium]|nr:GDP-mannose 4,6-dehydratase [Steroidobacteraceae bacterium]
MNGAGAFARPEFISAFRDFTAWRGQCVGLTGERGVLGGLLRERFAAEGIACEAYPGDINDPAALAAWFAGRTFSQFYHFAALVPVAHVEADPLLAYQTNVIGTYNVCRQLLLTQRQCWLFHCSSSHVYQPTATPVPISEQAATVPPSFYGRTKLAAEDVVRTLLTRLDVPHCIGRVFSFSHARQAPPYLVPSLRQRIGALPPGATLQVDNPSAVRDIQDAEYVIDAILHLARKRATGTVNIGTGVGRSVRDIARALAREAGRDIDVAGAEREPAGSLIADTGRLRALIGA